MSCFLRLSPEENCIYISVLNEGEGLRVSKFLATRQTKSLGVRHHILMEYELIIWLEKSSFGNK